MVYWVYYLSLKLFLKINKHINKFNVISFILFEVNNKVGVFFYYF